MSERLGFHIELEGAEETINSLNSMLGDVTRVTSVIGTADYAFTSWTRAVKEFDISSFIRSLIATVTLMRSLITVTQMATVNQQALLASVAAGQGQAALTQWMSGAGAAAAGRGLRDVDLSSLLGPIGIILSVTLTIYGVAKAIHQQNVEIAEQMRKDREDQERRAEIHESFVVETEKSESHEDYERSRRQAFRSVVPG